MKFRQKNLWLAGGAAMFVLLGMTGGFAQESEEANEAPVPAAEEPAEAGGETSDGEPLEFTHILDNSPLDVYTPRSGEEFTAEVEEFHVTGENPYGGDGEAVAEGQRLYNRWCQACHMPDGSGRMGPPLNDETFRYERVATDKGEFEVIYGGAAGAMQAFGDRLNQDEILRLMAFTETLRSPH